MKKLLGIIITAMLVVLAACGNKESSTTEDNGAKKETKPEMQTIAYLDKEYKLPANIKTIVTASQEAMEDAAVLGVKPAGALATAGEFPAYLGDSMSEAQDIGDKFQPNTEKLLQIKPDIILGTSKFKPEVVKNLNKVATMIPVSHISVNWKENLLLMGNITDKQAQAEEIIATYEKEAKELKEKLSTKLSNQKVMMIRIRAGNIYIYPESIYFNPVFYQDLGLTVPNEIKAAKAQEMISLEKLAEINPDYIFVQFEKAENPENENALKEYENNAVWNSMKAVKNKKVYTNAIDPMAAGGTAWSKTNFLDVLQEKLGE
ncbi:ABC transporter substrate-binding protein [Niallia sp. NCCP-28]|uniref:ABC transporter substrate-binding protein n=1 Tax=Niallia sp. NCCP-28 TaxID=2934712 RepID=UPI00208857DA|nr:ABC transporter substrate-binding protein [Niallia sp. NCCP-28]GKU81661.1 iron-uptake system-binding protein [Niallia sp. NCCP-28]